MEAYVIKNPISTPEEMARLVGLSDARLESLRRIMETPDRPRIARKSRKAPAKSGKKAVRAKAAAN